MRVSDNVEKVQYRRRAEGGARDEGVGRRMGEDNGQMWAMEVGRGCGRDNGRIVEFFKRGRGSWS